MNQLNKTSSENDILSGGIKSGEGKKLAAAGNRDHVGVIQASWERCREFGLNHTSEPVLQRLSSGEFNDLKDKYLALVFTTENEVLPYYEHILSNARCMISLTDSDAQVLNNWGDRCFLEPARKAFFDQGVTWKEQVNGTSAIGTSLATRQAIQVLRDEHFLNTNRFMIGSAAPIYDVNGELLGILAVSSDSYLPQAHTVGLVSLMSQAVENRLMVNAFRQDHFFFTFNTNLDNIDSQWSGLVVFDEQGTIVSVNRRAERLLGVELARAHIADIFSCTLEMIKTHSEQQPFSVLALGKYQMHGLIKKPQGQIICTTAFDQQRHKAVHCEPAVAMGNLSFGDPHFDRCLRQAQRVLEKDVPLLIHGETGVGKEVFVNALHEHSSRSQYPLVAVNCAAIPAELVESELFGYERGAFTGASNKGSIGFIRKAHKGTLFLDEIGEMPVQSQVRLLRVLQERRVTPLGSATSYAVDVKLISATNCCLRDAVAAGMFRRDLYYRISGLNIQLPSLRERTDRRQLFIEIHRRHRGPEHAKKLPEEILNLFDRHPWPGNVRQLINVIQIAMAMAEGEPIQPWHLPDDFFADIECAYVPSPLQAADKRAAMIRFPLEPVTVVNERDKVSSDDKALRVYNRNQGNISRAARDLGISRNTLYKRLRALGVK